MAIETGFAGVMSQFGARADVQDILSALLDDIISALCIVAFALLIHVILKRCYGRSVPSHAQARKKAVSGPCDDAVERKRASDLANTTDLRLFAEAVRSGRAAELPKLLDQVEGRRAASAGRPQDAAEHVLSDLTACLRMCVTAGCFKEGLAAYDHVAARLDATCVSIWSVLLYCAIEVGDVQRCHVFMEKVWEQGDISSKDLINMSRCLARQHDVQGMIQLLRRFRNANHEIDILTRNRILAACTACRHMDMAEAVLVEALETPMDIIGYHTLIKGHSQSGNLERCLEFYKQLRLTIEPTSITFGLLLDACVDAGSVDGARLIFTDLQNSRGLLNVVHYTTFLRCLTTAGEFDEACQTFENMLATPGVTPDVGSWYCLVKSLADNGLVDKSLRVVERVREHQFEVSQATFNVVLNGCSVGDWQPGDIFEVFERLLKLGMQPTTPILSVMIKALSNCEAWSQAEQLLGSIHSRFGSVPEERLYAQLKRARKTPAHSKGRTRR